MSLNIYEQIYSKLKRIGILDENGVMQPNYMRFTCIGLMDLSVNRLTDNTLVLAHNGIQNVEIKIDPKRKRVEALTFQNDHAGIYQKVYNDEGSYSPVMKNYLNEFLDSWLQNIIDAGYVLAEKED